MQSYSGVFARVHNAELDEYASEIAPKILGFYSNTPIAQSTLDVLDLCCGTGKLANSFLRAGYKVVGIDLSKDMLFYAKQNNQNYVSSGHAEFIAGNATDFSIDKTFGLVVSTYDAINHLEDQAALLACFKCVFPILAKGGYFIFDLNTRASLANWKWHSIEVLDREDLMMVTRGIYNEQLEKAYFKWSGFIHVGDGLYERFEQTICETVFYTEDIKRMLLNVGWRQVHFARIEDLSSPIDEPEKIDEENAVVVVAQK